MRCRSGRRRRRKFDDDDEKDDDSCCIPCGWCCCHLLNIVWAVLFGFLYYNYEHREPPAPQKTSIDAPVEWILKQIGEGSTLEEHPLDDKWWITRPAAPLSFPNISLPALEWVLQKLDQESERTNHDISDSWWQERPQSLLVINATSVHMNNVVVKEGMNTYGQIDFWPGVNYGHDSSRRLRTVLTACDHCTSYLDHYSCKSRCVPHTMINNAGEMTFSHEKCNCDATDKKELSI